MKLLCVAIAALVLIACSGQPDPGTDTGKEKPKQDIFPVRSFLEGQVHLVDSLGLPVLKFTTVNHTTDSVLISLEEFKSLSQEFTHPDISDPSLRKRYTENSFADQSIPSITLTYSATDKNLEIQRLDVLIAPNPVQDDKVKSIYIEKAGTQNGTSVFKKLYWRTNREFQIITSSQQGSLPATVTLLKVKWDNSN